MDGALVEQLVAQRLRFALRQPVSVVQLLQQRGLDGLLRERRCRWSGKADQRRNCGGSEYGILHALLPGLIDCKTFLIVSFFIVSFPATPLAACSKRILNARQSNGVGGMLWRS